MQIKLTNYVIENLQDFKLNLTLLNEIVYATATVLSPVAVTYKQNLFQVPRWKLSILKIPRRICILDEMRKAVKVKTRKARK